MAIEELVEELKNNIKYIHTFLILFNGQEPRLSMGLQSMIRLFEKMFGNHFWKNVILGVRYACFCFFFLYSNINYLPGG